MGFLHSDKNLQGPSHKSVPDRKLARASSLSYLISQTLGHRGFTRRAWRNRQNEALFNRHHMLANIRSLGHHATGRRPHFLALQGSETVLQLKCSSFWQALSCAPPKTCKMPIPASRHLSNVVATYSRRIISRLHADCHSPLHEENGHLCEERFCGLPLAEGKKSARRGPLGRHSKSS